MFLKVRYRCTLGRRYLTFQSRHFSYINCKNKKEGQQSEEQNDEQPSYGLKKEDHERMLDERTPSSSNSRGRFSSAVSSFLNSSLHSLEDYIASQTPIQNNRHMEGYNTEVLEIDTDADEIHQDGSIGNIRYDISVLNRDYDEFIDLADPNHIEALLAINKERWYKSSPEISQSIEKTSNVNIPLILNFYIRSLPEIQNQLKDATLNTRVGENSIKLIISLLINLQWFRSACLILVKLKLPFNDLVNYLNDLMEDEPIFQKSDWMRYLFIINFYQLYRNINPLVLTNIDFLGRTANMNRFKILNMMWKTQYTSKSKLKEDVDEWYELAGNDVPVNLMYIYKSIDLIKYNNQFDLSRQLNDFKILIGTSSNSIISQKHFLGSFLRHLTSFNKFELNHLQSAECKLSKKEIKEFMNKRKDAIINFIVLSKKLPIKSFDTLAILGLKPPTNVGLQLWEYHLQGMNNGLLSSVYNKIMVAHFVNQLAKTNKINEIVRVEFSNLSSSKKTNLIISGMVSYLKNDNISTRNRVGGYIALTNQQREHSHVMKGAIHRIFSRGGITKFNYSDLLKILELISSFSPTVSNKEGLFEIGNQIIESNNDNADFYPFTPREKFIKTIEFLDLLKAVDPESKTYVTRLVPSIITFYHEYILSMEKSSMDPKEEPEFKQLCYILNKTFDVACKNPRELSLLNPKNYSSKIYITNQGLLQKVSGKLFRLPKNILFPVLRSRANWICSDQEDWISKFHKTVFTFGIFLEVLVRRSTREEHGGNINFSDLNDTQFEKALEDEMDTIASNETIWECVEMLSGFEWNKDISDVLFRGRSISDGKEEPEIGSGIVMVLSEVKKLNGTVYTKRHDAIQELLHKEDDNNGVESFDDVTDALLDSVENSPLEEEQILDVLKHSAKESETGITVSRGLLDQDLLEFNELYRNMKNYEQFVPQRNQATNDEKHLTIANAKRSVGPNKVKKRYTIKEKERLVRFYSPLRLKGMLIESLIARNPKLIDAVIRRLYVEYETRIPVSLLHSAMIGMIKSDVREVDFADKVNVIKILDTLASIIYSTASQKVHSYLFMNCVRFREFRIRLVDMVIAESKRSNSGSLKTLNWAVNKITNTPNMNRYKNEFARWTNELNNMKEMRAGFWDPGNTGKWIKDDK